MTSSTRSDLPARRWLHGFRFWDALCAFGERSRAAWRQVLGRPAGRRRPQPRPRRRTFYPRYEALERREVPYSDGFYIGAAEYFFSEADPDPFITLGLILDNNPSASGSVDYHSQDGSGGDAAHAGYDYTAFSGTYSDGPWPPGGDIVHFSITNDNVYEGDEQFTVYLDNATLGLTDHPYIPVAVIHIIDDDQLPKVSFSDPSYSVTEPSPTDPGTGFVTITVTLDHPVEHHNAVIGYKTVELCGCGNDDPVQAILQALDHRDETHGQATEGEDYLKAVGVLKFPDFGDDLDHPEVATTRTFTVAIKGDDLAEGGEDFAVQLNDPYRWDMPGVTRAIVTIRDNPANGVTTTYDAQDQPTLEEFPDSTSRSWTYDGTTHQPLTYTDERGGVTTFAYDGSGNLQTRIDPLGQVTTFTYDGGGRVTSQAGPAAPGTTAPLTTYTYNGDGRLTGVAYPDATTEGFTYTANGDLLTHTNRRGYTTSFAYDADYNRTAEADPLGHRTTYTYNGDGRVQTETDPLGRTTAYTYDAYGNVATVTRPDPDGAGPLTSAVTTTVYDSGGLLQSSTDPLGRTTTYTYTGGGRLATVTEPDPDGAGPLTSRVTTYTYDDANHRVTVTDPLGLLTTSTYDTRGRLLTRTDVLGNATTFTYDAAGHVLTETDPLGHTATYAYDAAGRQTGMTDVLGHRSTTVYDGLGRVQATIDVLANRTTYAYDNTGRQTGVQDVLGNWTTTTYDGQGNVTAVQPAGAGLTQYAYDELDRQTAVIDPLGNRTTTVYDAAGQAVATIDPYGKTTTFVYDNAGRQVAVQDVYGQFTTTAYDAAGQAVGTVDPYGNRATYSYDGAGRRTVVEDYLGNRTTTAYDGFGHVVTTTDVYGQVTTFSYDGYGRASGVLDPLGGRTTTTYDGFGRVQTQTDVFGQVTTLAYDGYGRQEAVVDALGHRTTTAYDGYGRAEATVDPLGHRTTAVYDGYGRVQATVDALGNRTTAVYDNYGRMQASIDARGNRTTTVYDSYARVQATVDALGNRTTTSYDGYSNVQAVQDALTHSTTFVYDGYGRREAIIDPLGNRTTMVYDNTYGRVSATLDGLGNRTTVLYDGHGRQEAVVDPLGHATTTVYDGFGRVAAVVDPLGHRTTTIFDAYGRPVATADALGNLTTTVLDIAGRQTALVDPNGNRTTFAYDALGHLSSQTDPFNHAATFAYDAAGRLSSTTDRLGRRRDFGYDDAGRKTGETWYASDGMTVDDRLTFTYDAAGNQLTAANGAGTYTLSYDALNRVSHVDEPFGAGLTFSYDAAGNRTEVRDGFGGITTSIYDAANELVTRLIGENTGGGMYGGGFGGSGLRVDLAYNAAGRTQNITRSSDLGGTPVVAGTTFTYDAAGRVTDLQHATGGGTNRGHYTVTYDAAGRVTADARDGAITPYSYDDSDQLTADGATTVTYDAAGNRDNGDYTPDTGNRLASDAAWNYSYDDEGNLTSKTLKGPLSEYWAYGYNQRNQLVSAEQRATSGGAALLREDFKYDAWGNRLEKALDADGAGAGAAVTTRFAQDGWDPARAAPVGTENFDVWADLDGGNANALKVQYLRGDAVDQVFARTEVSGGSQTPYWLLTDRLGSVRDVLDNSGAVQDTIAYDGFGNIASESAPAARGRYAWTGREYDAEIGLQYNRARYYDAHTGRWTSQDPLGFDAGDSNLYRYVRNRSNKATDPSGLQDFVDWGFRLSPVKTYSFSSTYWRGNDDIAFPNYQTAEIKLRLGVTVTCSTASFVFTYSAKAMTDDHDWHKVKENLKHFKIRAIGLDDPPLWSIRPQPPKWSTGNPNNVIPESLANYFSVTGGNGESLEGAVFSAAIRYKTVKRTAATDSYSSQVAILHDIAGEGLQINLRAAMIWSVNIKWATLDAKLGELYYQEYTPYDFTAGNDKNRWRPGKDIIKLIGRENHSRGDRPPFGLNPEWPTMRPPIIK
jgi:RHS repeat-associated protein